MSAAVRVVSFTMAIAGESEFADGVGAGAAAASFVFAGVVCIDGRVAVGLRATGLGLAFCATAVAANTSASTNTKGDGRFIKCIFLIASKVVNSSLAGEFLHCGQRVDFVRRFVAAKSYDARKAQSVAALVPIRWLHAVECHFDDDSRLDDAHAAL